MSILKRRIRTVSFRLSKEEYDVMQERCISEGARSISDFARAMACGYANNGALLRHDLETEAKLRQLRQRIEELEHDLQRVVQFMEPPKPAAKRASSSADRNRPQAPRLAAKKEE
jgi:50S ribosomal subunit-associated GTPase HflX